MIPSTKKLFFFKQLFRKIPRELLKRNWNVLENQFFYHLARKLLSLIHSKLINKSLFNSLLLPSIIDSVKNVFGLASNNSDTITIITTQFNKLNDLLKLFEFANKLFQSPNGNTSPLVSATLNVKLLFKYFRQLIL